MIIPLKFLILTIFGILLTRALVKAEKKAGVKNTTLSDIAAILTSIALICTGISFVWVL